MQRRSSQQRKLQKTWRRLQSIRQLRNQQWSKRLAVVGLTQDRGLFALQCDAIGIIVGEEEAGTEAFDFSKLPALFVALRPVLTRAMQHVPPEEPDLNLVLQPMRNLSDKIGQAVPALQNLLRDSIEVFRDIIVPNHRVREAVRLFFRCTVRAFLATDAV